jgi:hypothetical protein
MAASPAGVTKLGWRDTGRSGSSTKSASLSLTKARLMVVDVVPALSLAKFSASARADKALAHCLYVGACHAPRKRGIQ